MLDCLNARLRGYRMLALAMLVASPDILTGLAGIDLTELLPYGWGTKAATLIAVLRVVAPVLSAQAKAKAGPADEGQG